MAVNDQYIFALYIGLTIKDHNPPYSGQDIHVFTWDGKPSYKIHVNESIENIALDTANHILYATDVEDNLYTYDISGL